MTGASVRVERHGGVAVLTLDRPKVNALSIALLGEIAGAVEQLGTDLPGALVITGAGRFFAAGADVREIADAKLSAGVPGAFRRALDAVAAFPRTTIAAISGVALGGGCELALACDLRVASADARLGQPEILLGIMPGGGATQRLARLVGPSRAKDLVLTGREVDAAEALRIGLVDRVTATGAALDEAIALARALASGPLLAQAHARRAIDEGAGLTLPEALDLEARLFAEVLATDDARTGLRSFLEEGPGRAHFSGS